jgi:hypothetical protein
MHGEDDIQTGFLVVESERKTLLVRPICTWETSIKISHKDAF